MKKLFLLLLVVCVMLCACGEKKVENKSGDVGSDTPVVEPVVTESGDPNAEFDAYMDNYLNKTYDGVNVNYCYAKTIPLNLDYAKEYYKICRDAERGRVEAGKMITISDPSSEYPILIIQNGDDKTVKAYSFDGKKANEVDASKYKYDEEKMKYDFEVASTFEMAVVQQAEVCTLYKDILDNNRSLEDVLDELRKVEDKYYGSDFTGFEDLETGESSEQELNIYLSSGDGNLYCELKDSTTNLDRVLKVEGIEGTVVKGVSSRKEDAKASNPSAIYELDDKGYLYKLIIPEKGNVIEAQKFNGIIDIIDIVSLNKYPTAVSEPGEEEFSFYACAYDGNLYFLED